MRSLYLVFGSFAVAVFLVLLLQSARPKVGSGPEASPTPTMPPETRRLLDKARDLSKAGDWVEPLRLLQQARVQDPRLPDTYLEAGRIYLAAGQPKGAVGEWKLGLERVGENAHLLLSLGLLCIEIERDPVSALSFLQRAERADPAVPGLREAMGETWAVTAEALFEKDDRAGAQAAAAKSLELQPDQASALAVQARLAERENRWAESADLWEKVFSRASTAQNRRSLAESHKRCGYLFLAKKDRQAAIPHFRRAVDLGAEGVALDAALDILSEDAKAAMEEGVRCFESGDYPKATERFSYSVSLLPENPLAHNHLGLALLKIGEREQAAAAWEEAIRQAAKSGFDLGSTPTHKNLVLLYGELGRPGDAERVAKDYLGRFPAGLYAAGLRPLEDPQKK